LPIFSLESNKKTQMHGSKRRQLFVTPESYVHAGLGVASFFVSPLLVVPYAAYQYSNSSGGGGGGDDQCKSTLHGLEYGIGYFGALLLYQYFLGLQY
jgi:hypothetical protein